MFVYSDEPGFYVDKYCIKTWRTKVLNMYEGQHSSAHKTSSRYGLSSSDDTSENNSNPTSEENMTYSLTPQTTEVPSSVLEEPDSKKKELNKSGGTISSHKKKLMTKNLNTCKKIQRHNTSETVTVPLSEIRECFVLCHKLQEILNNPNSPTNTSYQSSPNLVNECKKLEVKLRKLATSPKSLKTLKSGRKSCSNRCNSTAVPLSRKLLIEEKTSSDNGRDPQLVHNGDNFAVKNEEDEENKTDDDSDDKGFNEAIVCSHGECFFFYCVQLCCRGLHCEIT